MQVALNVLKVSLAWFVKQSTPSKPRKEQGWPRMSNDGQYWPGIENIVTDCR